MVSGMSRMHHELSPERWAEFSSAERLANVGAEIGRAISWRRKGKEDIARNAADRALELFDLTLAVTQSFNRLKEIARLREVWVDFFYFENSYQSTAQQWERSFYYYNLLARSKRTTAS